MYKIHIESFGKEQFLAMNEKNPLNFREKNSLFIRKVCLISSLFALAVRITSYVHIRTQKTCNNQEQPKMSGTTTYSTFSSRRPLS